MIGKLRASPGAYGLVTANGWYLTKHALGLYSGYPTRDRWAFHPVGPRRGDVVMIDLGEAVLV